MSVSRALGFGLFALAWGACGGRSSSGASADAGNSDCRLPPDTASLPTDDAAAGAPPLVSDASRAGAAGDPVDAGGNAGASDGGEAPLVDAGAAGAEGEPRSDGAGGGCGRAAGARFATSVVDHAFGGGQNFNQEQGFPGALLGPPVAGDPTSVVSLGNGGWLILEFAGNAVVDGPGVDFTVFENPLADFRELGTVAVSDDLRTWVEFPCTASQTPTTSATARASQSFSLHPRMGSTPSIRKSLAATSTTYPTFTSLTRATCASPTAWT